MKTEMKTLILGLGNPMLGDDGVGWRVAEACAIRLRGAAQTEVDCLATGGLSLMERMVGYDRAILVDAITTGDKPPGAIYCFRIEELPNASAGHTGSAHDASLQTALQLGRRMGATLPASVIVVAVEAQQVYDFSETLSPAVATAVPRAVEMVVQILREQGSLPGE